MSQNPSYYIEDVPVKISERYKPPPKVSLPLSVYQRLNSADEIPSPSLDYDFSLEHSVISKIEQLKKVRENDRECRRERLRKAEIQRIRQIEEKQKELLTAVSYPNAEDLSSDDEAGNSAASNNIGTSSIDVTAATVVQFSPSQQRFDTILTPTIVPDTCNQVNYNTNKSNLSKINYSDFENDTSSPFDNVELKTINDLDILAQVLNINQTHSTQDHEMKTVSIKEPPDNNCENVINSNSNTFYNHTIPISNENSNSVIHSTGIYTHPEPQNFSHNSNNFYTFNQNTVQNYSSVNGLVKNGYYYYNNLPNNENHNNYMFTSNYQMNTEQHNLNARHHHQQQQQQQQQHQQHQQETSKFLNENASAVVGYVGHDYEYGIMAAQAKSKSKSVPDILKELNDEVRDSEIRRARNHSQTLEDCDRDKKTKILKENDKKQDDAIYMKLSPSSQLLAKNISLMGFPLDRVSRIAEKFGNDDKKIVEHLIPLSELLDLGFEESNISDALLKFDNNKEKALDFLIT